MERIDDGLFGIAAALAQRRCFDGLMNKRTSVQLPVDIGQPRGCLVQLFDTAMQRKAGERGACLVGQHRQHLDLLARWTTAGADHERALDDIVVLERKSPAPHAAGDPNLTVTVAIGDQLVEAGAAGRAGRHSIL